MENTFWDRRNPKRNKNFILVLKKLKMKENKMISLSWTINLRKEQSQKSIKIRKKKYRKYSTETVKINFHS